MATSDFWQRVSASVAAPSDWSTDTARESSRSSQGKVKFWIALDFLTVLIAATTSTIYERHTTPVIGAREFYNGTLFNGRSMWILLGLLCAFGRHASPSAAVGSPCTRPRASALFCTSSGSACRPALFRAAAGRHALLIHAEDISRSMVLMTVALVTVRLSVRRLVYGCRSIAASSAGWARATC